uniref:DUF4283 domain-containing protein n=1 Tax=Tanacetum cinerariifolium TaxID=118510 RepID=A0A6L2K5W1_TANCI|nr:hypothetical protein [Tanacetum cinerariifolium]
MNDVGTTVGPTLVGGNGVDVVVPVESNRAISDRFANTAYGFFLEKRVAFLVVANYVKNTWGKYELDVNLMKEDVVNVLVWLKLHGVLVTAFSDDGLSVIATKRDNIVVAMPKLVREGFYTFTVRVEYEWKPPRCACHKVFVHVQDECLKIIKLDVVKNTKKPSQTPRGVLVGHKVGFQPTKQVYRHVPKKNNVSAIGNKKKDVKPTKEVNKSNSFDVLNLVENNVDLGTAGGTSNLTIKRPILILVIDGTATPMDDEGILLKMVDSSGDHDSDDEVESESYGDGEYDYDPYNDDMYEGQDIPDKIQDICDNLDIKVRGRKKK